MLKIIVFFISFIAISSLTTLGQSFSITRYRASDGLDTDVIKCVVQDSIGFIWIGSDDGLIRYDGVHFVNFPKAASSTYFKDFLLTKDQRILAAHDLGIIEIHPGLDTTHITDFIKGGHVKSDSLLWYPKLLHEDLKGNIWISEPQSVICASPTGEWKRFDFGNEDNSNSFVRSFSFINLSPDSLLISSNKSNFYIYSHESEDFTRMKRESPPFECTKLFTYGNKIFAATSSGLKGLQLVGNKIKVVTISNMGYITDVVTDYNADEWLVCSEDSVSYTFNPKSQEIKIVENLNLSISQAYKTNDDQIWLSTLKGIHSISLLQFRTIDLSVSRVFVEAVFSNPEHQNVYVLGKSDLWGVDALSEQVVSRFSHKNGYFLSGALASNGMWISNEFQLWHLTNGKVMDTVDLSHDGRYVFDVHADAFGNLWVSQEASVGVKEINPTTKKINYYKDNEGLSKGITTIEHSERGVFVATSDNSSYLFFKSYDSPKFNDVSHPIEGLVDESFVVNDLQVVDEAVFMATKDGLYKWTQEGIEKYQFKSGIEHASIKALEYDGQFLWFGNMLGLFRLEIETGEYSQFNENTGMIINSVNEEGITIFKDKIWAGTSQGIVVKDYNSQGFRPTNQPVFLKVMVNGTEQSVEKPLNISRESLLEIEFSALTYPSNIVEYSYRIPGVTQGWTVPTKNSLARLSDLPDGRHEFEVRARKMGNYVWSDATQISFQVDPRFHERPIFYLLLVLGLIIASIVTRQITRLIMKRRQQFLQRLVEERTYELNEYKNNLEELVRNRTQQLTDTQSQLVQTEKMASLGVMTAGIAHEINNPMNYIQSGLYGLDTLIKNSAVFGKDDRLKGDVDMVMKNMQFGVDRVTGIVSSLKQYSRSKPDHKESCDIHQILDNCVQILGHEIKNHCEVIKSYDKKKIEIIGDSGQLHQLFTNILSNATQAVENGGKVQIITHRDADGKIEVRIKDDGMGIPKEKLDKIFDPFYTTKDPGVGTGLGLFISHRIVQEHKGSIKFESVEGKGTIVIIKFR